MIGIARRRYKTTDITASIDGEIYVGALRVYPDSHGIVKVIGNLGVTKVEVLQQCFPEIYPDNEPRGRLGNRGGKKKVRLKSGERNSRFKGWYVIRGKRYASLRIAGEKTGENFRTISARVKRGEKGYSFKPK